MLGNLENNPNKNGADKILSGYYYDEKSVEEAESFLQKTSFNLLLKKSKLKKEDIDLLISSDLQSQLLASHLAFKNNSIPFLGIYSACASFTEALIIASGLLNNKAVNNICINSSSHNLSSERTFRFPIEYGFSPKKTCSFSTTGSVSALLSSTPSKIKVESATIGEIVDIGFKDVNNMGAAMVPSAAKVIYNHFKNNKRKPEYYDLILTGDLGCYGSLILKEYLDKEYNMKIEIKDAGSLIFNNDNYAGGSGPFCLPFILFSKILKSKKYKKILIVGTGCLHSSISTKLNLSVPSISHAVSLEVI